MAQSQVPPRRNVIDRLGNRYIGTGWRVADTRQLPYGYEVELYDRTPKKPLARRGVRDNPRFRRRG
jgi:hypothetical protein